MKVSGKRLKVIHGSAQDPGGSLKLSRLQLIAVVVAGAVLLVGGAQWPKRDAGPAPYAVSQAPAEAQAEPTAFEYFPAQYVNQAKEVEEYIQAF